MESMKHSYDVGKIIRSSKRRTSILCSRSLMPVYRVGEPLLAGQGSWMDGTQLSHKPSGYELTLIRSNLNCAGDRRSESWAARVCVSS